MKGRRNHCLQAKKKKLFEVMSAYCGVYAEHRKYVENLVFNKSVIGNKTFHVRILHCCCVSLSDFFIICLKHRVIIRMIYIYLFAFEPISKIFFSIRLQNITYIIWLNTYCKHSLYDIKNIRISKYYAIDIMVLIYNLPRHYVLIYPVTVSSHVIYHRC